MTDWKPPGPGALDDTAWSEQLIGRAVERGDDDDRVHGYAVLGDVARRGRFSDLCYLQIAGELPGAQASRWFHLALCSAATVWAGDAAAHIAILCRLSGGSIAAAIAAGMVAAADEVHVLVEAHVELLTWLDEPTRPVPTACTGSRDAWTATLIAACGDARPAMLRDDMTRPAAVIALLHAAGITARPQLEAALIVARATGIPAEPLLTGPEHLGQYPVKVPEFRYVETPQAPQPPDQL